MDTTPIKEFAIPLLPSISISQTLVFYQALGFRVTYQQKSPNAYTVLKIKEIEIHFFALKQLKPEANFSSCYLVVNDIDTLYASFVAGLKKESGKLPTRGIPRINPLKNMAAYGVRQFVVVDPSGNYIRIGQPIAKTDSLIFPETDETIPSGISLVKAYELGSRLADGKEDLTAAATVLDKALAETTQTESIDFLRVLILRADIALRLADSARFEKLCQHAENLLQGFDSTTVQEETRLITDWKDRRS